MDRRGFLTVTAKMLAAVTIPTVLNVPHVVERRTVNYGVSIVEHLEPCQAELNAMRGATFVVELTDFGTAIQVGMKYEGRRYGAVYPGAPGNLRGRRLAVRKMKYLLWESAGGGGQA